MNDDYCHHVCEEMASDGVFLVKRKKGWGLRVCGEVKRRDGSLKCKHGKNDAKNLEWKGKRW
jgi:3-methyladenine DNA glycosylase AlkD